MPSFNSLGPPLTVTVVNPQRGVNIQGVTAGLYIDGDNILHGSGTATDFILNPGPSYGAGPFYLVFSSTAPGNHLPFISTAFSIDPFTGAFTADNITVINPIIGSITGNAATVTTNANMTGDVTSVGNVTAISSSVNLPGSPTTTTQATGDNSNKIATTSFVNNAISTGGLTEWVEVFGSTTMLVNKGYVANNSSQVVLTLPPTSVFGDKVRIAGKGAGGWKVAQNAGQIIHFGDKVTTLGTGGSIESENPFDIIELLCTTPNTNWTELSTQGNMLIT